MHLSLQNFITLVQIPGCSIANSPRVIVVLVDLRQWLSPVRHKPPAPTITTTDTICTDEKKLKDKRHQETLYIPNEKNINRGLKPLLPTTNNTTTKWNTHIKTSCRIRPSQFCTNNHFAPIAVFRPFPKNYLKIRFSKYMGGEWLSEPTALIALIVIWNIWIYD